MGMKQMGKILVGISSWADPELIESGFYPPEIKTPSGRLGYYAANFPVVEMDSSYHFLPTLRNLNAWIAATPAGFSFDVKAYSLLTQHPTPFNSLPRDIRDRDEIAGHKDSNLYLHHLPADIIDLLWERFDLAVRPLFSAGKLGLISFQFPPWYHPNEECYQYIEECQKRLPRYRLAIEFRSGGWLDDERLEKTLQVLKDYGLGLVCVDEPQGLKSSVPPITEVTASFAVVRFHGRNRENWERKNVSPNEKYNYLYDPEELKEWAAKIRLMDASTEKVFVIFKNKHWDFAVKNAKQMMELLN